MALRVSVIVGTRNSDLRSPWKCDEKMDKQRYPVQKLKYLGNTKLDLDYEIEVQRICAQNEAPHVNWSEKPRKKSRSFDLGFLRPWRREFFPRHIQQQGKKKLTRQCRSLEGVILEEETVLDNSLSRQKLQSQGRSLDLFELPSALKQLGRSLRAKR